MKYLLAAILFICSANGAEIVNDSKGNQILIFDNKTWKYYKINSNNSKKTPKKEAKKKNYGEWKQYVSNNPIDDSKTVTLINEKSYASSKWGKEPFIVVRCQSNKTELYINAEEFLTTQNIKVTTRLDNKKASTKWWNTSTDYKAMFYRGKTISFIKQMIDSNSLVVHYTPYGQNPRTLTFNLVGLADSIETLRNTCHW